MAINVGQSANAVGNPATTAGVATQATGSTFVVVQISAPAAAHTAASDNKGNSYTQIGSDQTNGAKMTVWRKENGAGGAGHAFTANCNGTALAIEITGAATASYDLGSLGQASDSASPFTVTSGILTQAAELVLAIIGGDSGTTPATHAESTGFTIEEAREDGAANWVGCIAYKIVAATTALTPSFTQAGSSNAVLTIAGFKDAGTQNALAWVRA